MSAGDVTAEMIATWREIAIAPREVGGIPEMLPILEALEASRAEVAALTKQRDEARRSLNCILEDIEDDDNGDGMNSQGIALWKIRTSSTLTEEAGKEAGHA